MWKVLTEKRRKNCIWLWRLFWKSCYEMKSKWRQRANEKDMKEGDGNTKYCHFNASGKRKKNQFLNYVTMEMKRLVMIRWSNICYKGLFG
jgi:hypothetical protein